MRPDEIIRRWKDEEYHSLPDNPAGSITLTDEEISGVEGGTTVVIATVIATIFFTLITCGISLCTCGIEDCG
jgi:mersacidin/lichenicidin family type 2 lantibiotic